MKRDGGKIRRVLRTDAESLLVNLTPQESSALPTEVLMHELMVHKVELEMQNEELRRAQVALEEARDRYVDLYEFAPVGYVTLNRQTQINKINLTGTALLGVARNQLVDHRFSEFVAAQDRDRWHRMFMNLMEHDEVGKQAFELEMLRGDGSTFFAHLDCLRDQDAQAPPMLRLTLIDISQLKRADAELRIAATAFESDEGMMITDAQTVILRVNQAFTRITGYSAQDVVGKTPHLFMSSRQDAKFYADMWETIHRSGNWSGEIWDRRKNGEIYPEHLRITAVKDQHGLVSNYVATLNDITLSKAVADEIQQLAFYDSLTGLPNRRLLLDRLQHAQAASTRSGKQGALMLIDLDNFKLLNDTLGHDIGDLLLQQVAARLITCVREGDTVARLGGDEFVLIMEGLSEDPLAAAAQAETATRKILALLNQPYQLSSHQHHSTPSIGVTLFSQHEAEIVELLKHADIAMYQAKSAGRNTLCFFDPSMPARVAAAPAALPRADGSASGP